MPNNKGFKVFEAKTLEEAYESASSSFSCSVMELDINIVQSPSKGFLGLFSKRAIIHAKLKHCEPHKENRNKKAEIKEKNIKVQSVSKKFEKVEKTEQKSSNNSKQIEKEKIFENFYDSNDEKIDDKLVIKKETSDLTQEISQKVNELFSKLCYQIDEIKVEILEDQNTVYIEFSGEDSALLIGKEGYRYKALSYILFNWINEKYGMMLRLEVAQFLQNQEEAIHRYLEPVIETIKEEGFYKTKILDGILVHIALTKLREEFPDKYVAVKTNQRGEKYILVNEYRN
jgi:spoIIIJ-associated protein